MEAKSTNTIRYTIKSEGFCYHTRKGVMRKGTTVSKSIHPVKAVEIFKNSLIDTRRVKDRGHYYECVKDIETGLLMAFNLHEGILKKRIPDSIVTINGGDKEDRNIKDGIRNKGFFSADNEFRKRIDRDCYKTTKILKTNYDDSFYKRTGDGSFSKVEKFVVDVLIETGAISNYRRGDTNSHECDIVDETEGRQIEIVSLFDEKIPASIRYKNDEMRKQSIALDSCDFGKSIIPEGVIRKFKDKEYSDRYEKELAIYTLSGPGDIQRKLDSLKDMVKELIIRGELKNDFKDIHLIIHDPLFSESVNYFSSTMQKRIDEKECSIKPIITKETKKEEITDNAEYFVLQENIFNSSVKKGAWMTGSDLKEFGII